MWVRIFLGSATLSKAGKFDFGETDPRNIPPEANFPSRIPHFETPPCMYMLVKFDIVEYSPVSGRNTVSHLSVCLFFSTKVVYIIL